MAICRVYLMTYRRNHLLPRALKSLLSQTRSDWVCEVHNDDPTDPFPRQLVEQLGDARITIADHPHNLGPTRAFNLIFQSVAEPFISLLEDDNWWEPEFLERMIHALEQSPTAQVAWGNMRCWQEETDGRWQDTGRSIWPTEPQTSPHLIPWGHLQQVMGALHSNGAMLLRSATAQYQTPDDTPFAAAEAIRERRFPFPLLFVPQVVANFAITQTTARGKEGDIWLQMQVLLTASFFKHTPDATLAQQLWPAAWNKPAKSTATLFFAALACPECRFLLRHSRWQDWLFFLAFCLRRPAQALKGMGAIATYPQLWQFLDRPPVMS